MSTRKQTKKYSYNSGSSGLSKPKKSLGQNFLNDQKVVQDIVLCADLTAADAVIEIGPGRGAMTGKLAERAGVPIVPVAVDSRCMPTREKGILSKVFKDFGRVDTSKDIRLAAGPLIPCGKSREMHEASFNWIASKLESWGLPTDREK